MAARKTPALFALRLHPLVLCSVVIASRLRYSRMYMVDIHCHIFHGLDDGPDSFETACAMAEMAVADGITHVIGTPHASPNHRFEPKLVEARRSEIQERFEGRLMFASGCDFHLSFENLRDIRLEPHRYTLNQKNYLLVEFADFSIPAPMDQVLHELQLAGLTPIITHPERNPLIRSKPERLFGWLRQGCFVQVTAQSLLGKFGKSALEVTKEWLEAGAIHFFASDGHNVTSRPPRLKETFDLLTQTQGEEVARALLLENPLAVFEGRPLPFVPELADSAGLRRSGRRRRKRFWFF
jgi:protein-tyrosine phosphatase